MKRTAALFSTLALFAAAVATQAQTVPGTLHEADAALAGRNDSAMPTSRADMSTREELLRSAPTTLTGLIRSSTAEIIASGCGNGGIELRRAKAIDCSIHLFETSSPRVTEPPPLPKTYFAAVAMEKIAADQPLRESAETERKGLPDLRGTLEGRVTDAAGGGVPGASVYVLGTSFGAGTDGDGRFRIQGLPSGSYTVRVVALTFKPVEQSVEVPGDQTSTLDFFLWETVEEEPCILISQPYSLQHRIHVNPQTTGTETILTRESLLRLY